MKLKEFEEARALLEYVVQGLTGISGEEDEQTLSAANSLAHARHNCGDFAGAVVLLKTIVDAYRRKHGVDSNITRKAAEALAVIEQEQKMAIEGAVRSFFDRPPAAQ